MHSGKSLRKNQGGAIPPFIFIKDDSGVVRALSLSLSSEVYDIDCAAASFERAFKLDLRRILVGDENQ